MRRLRVKDKPARKNNAALMVRLDGLSKASLTKAAKARGVSVSDYVRIVTVAQARKEVAAGHERIIAMTPEEQLAFWTALDATPRLTPAQKRLAALMRGKS